jgi:AcrR family transcriptional regulator
MAYRRTDRTETRLAAVRARLIREALNRVAEGGWAAASVAEVARAAGIATGSVYQHVASKDALLVEVFRLASTRELEAVTVQLARPGPMALRLERAVTTFAVRALRGRRLAYALLAEPVAPAVEQERLRFRRAYHEAFAGLLREGEQQAALPPQDVDISAAALTGAISEALVGPLSPAEDHPDPQSLVDALVALCLRAVAVQPACQGVC